MIAKGSGKTWHEFARENLFDPLGMGSTEGATGPDGEPFAASGARMSVHDLARIGVMMLHGGKVDERVVVRPTRRSRRGRTSHHGLEKRIAAHARRRFKRKTAGFGVPSAV